MTLYNNKNVFLFRISVDKSKYLLEFPLEPANIPFLVDTHTVNKINNKTYHQFRVYIIMTCTETDPRIVLLQRTYSSRHRLQHL